MSKRPKINMRQRDIERINNVAKRFNSKIYKTRNKPELQGMLPDTMKKADVNNLINDLKELPRSEFNKRINSLERFTKKGSTDIITSKTGNKVIRWEKNEIALKVAEINRERTRERKIVENMNVTSQGENIGLKRGQMGSNRLNALKPKKFNFDKIRGGKEWEKYKAGVERQATPQIRDKLLQNYKDNYIKGLGEYGGYADDIIKIVEQLPADMVVQTFYEEQEATIEFYYEGIEGLQEKDLVLQIIHNLWSNKLKEYEANSGL